MWTRSEELGVGPTGPGADFSEFELEISMLSIGIFVSSMSRSLQMFEMVWIFLRVQISPEIGKFSQKYPNLISNPCITLVLTCVITDGIGSGGFELDASRIPYRVCSESPSTLGCSWRVDSSRGANRGLSMPDGSSDIDQPGIFCPPGKSVNIGPYPDLIAHRCLSPGAEGRLLRCASAVRGVWCVAR